MSVIKQFFSGAENGSALQPKRISIDTLKQLIPIRNLGEEQLTAFSLETNSEVFSTGSVLFKSGEQGDSVLYLLEGTVELEMPNGNKIEITTGTAKSRFPLSSGKQHTATGRALTDVHTLRVSSKIMGSSDGFNQEKASGIELELGAIPPELKSSKLFQAFLQDYNNGELNLPTLPKVAIKLRDAMESEDIGINDAVKIVQLDPVIATKLIQVANCPLYVANNPVRNCNDAVQRLGLNATRNLVVSVSMKQVFSGKNKLIKNRLMSLWKESIRLSSLCFVLAKETKKVNPDEALLAGLVSNIGIVPFLLFADNFPTKYFDEKELDLAIPFIRGAMGSLILNKWDFPSDLVNVPRLVEEWYQNKEDKLNVIDIVVLSKLHSYIGSPQSTELPAICSIPAYSKLDDGTLSPDLSLNVLHEAKDKINEARRFFE